MPRTARASVGGVCHHVINRGNAQAEVFHKDASYQAFVNLLADACERLPMRVLACCLMPNHFHLALWPRSDGGLSRWVQRLMTAQVRRYHRHCDSNGHVWQGRFKGFPIQQDGHLLTVLRYIEQNPVRAKLVPKAQDWPWSSLWWCRKRDRPAFLHAGPVDRGRRWLVDVNQPITGPQLECLRRCARRGTSTGSDTWIRRMAARLGLESTLRPLGRPRKEPDK